MVLVNLGVAETEKSGGVVVEDIAFLFRCQEWRFLDYGNTKLDHARPNHLVRAEHDSLTEACVP